MTGYSTLRSVHLLCGLVSLPALLMYGISAVQMAHSSWFPMKPAVSETHLRLAAGEADGRRIARQLTAHRGEIQTVRRTPDGFEIRIAVPGTVHDVRYTESTGAVHVRTSVAGTMGMLNRLHHAAGLWHEYGPLRAWATFVAIVSFATAGLGFTGLWMWWLRRQERVSGLILLLANLAFSITVLYLLRRSGP